MCIRRCFLRWKYTFCEQNNNLLKKIKKEKNVVRIAIRLSIDRKSQCEKVFLDAIEKCKWQVFGDFRFGLVDEKVSIWHQIHLRHKNSEPMRFAAEAGMRCAIAGDRIAIFSSNLAMF